MQYIVTQSIITKTQTGVLPMSTGFVFIGGISGVFIGMTLIYLSIKITALITDRFPEKSKETPS
jgi:hypothetical protein